MDAPAEDFRRTARKARRHARHRAALLDAARKVLAREGLPGFTVARVAEAADVSKPSFYYYFRSREELVAALADQIAAEEATVITRAAYAAPDGAGAVDSALRTLVEWYLEDLDRYRLLYQWPAVIGIVPGFLEQTIEPRRQQALTVLEQRLSDGLPEVRDQDRHLSAVTLATAHGLVATLAGMDALGADLRDQAPGLVEVASAALKRQAKA